MILPEKSEERHGALNLMIEQCERNSRVTRRSEAEYLMRMYELGADNGRAQYNMLKQMVNASTADLIDPEAIKFEVGIPAFFEGDFTEEEDAARDDLKLMWHTNGIGHVIEQAVRDGHVYNSVFTKMYGRGEGIEIGMLNDPADFGTAHEDLDALSDLPYFTHWYTLTLPQFERLMVQHPKYAELMRHVVAYATAPDRTNAATLPPALVIAQSNPTMIGNVNQLPAGMDEPTVYERVVKIAELWWFDSRIGDWRIAKQFCPTRTIIMETADNPLEIKREHPFSHLCLAPKTGYLYGTSMLKDIIPLQQELDSRLQKVYTLNDRQLRPAVLFDGFPGLIEEKAERVIADGGVLASPMPGASMKELTPPMPPDVFAIIDRIERMAGRVWGMPMARFGEGQPNVRSGDQEGQLAALSSGPVRNRASRVASFIERNATLLLRMRQKELARPLRKTSPTGDQTMMLLAQMPDELYARVWGHLASPIMGAAVERKALIAKKEGVITAETLGDLLDLPFPDKVRKEARAMAKSRAEYQGIAMQLKMREVKAKEARAMK